MIPLTHFFKAWCSVTIDLKYWTWLRNTKAFVRRENSESVRIRAESVLKISHFLDLSWLLPVKAVPLIYFTKAGTADMPKSNVFRHLIVAGNYFLQGPAAPLRQKIMCFYIRSSPGPIFYKGLRCRCVKKIRCFDIYPSPGPIFYKDPKKGGFQKAVCFDIRSLPGPIFYNKKIRD